MRKMSQKDKHKATIETIINSAALALTAFGVAEIIAGSPRFPFGYLALSVGIFLEWFKYMGRAKKLW